jgi:Zn-dependent protease with chaperone function
MAQDDITSVCPSFRDIGSASERTPFRAGKGTLMAELAHPAGGAVLHLLNAQPVAAVLEQLYRKYTDSNAGLKIASGICINETNFPKTYKLAMDCAKTTGIRMPKIVISNDLPNMNAMALEIGGAAYIAIGSMIPLMMDEAEQRFIIGHECGHLSIGQTAYSMAYTLIQKPGLLDTLLGHSMAASLTYPLAQWHRMNEIVCDRAGLVCCTGLKSSQSALMKSELGLATIMHLDGEQYMRESLQALDGMRFSRRIEKGHGHPLLAKRLKALKCFYNSERYYRSIGLQSAASIYLYSDSELESSINEIINN